MSSPVAAQPVIDFSNRALLTGAINTRLDELLKQTGIEAQCIGQPYGDLLITVRTLIGRGGKRLRPLLVVWAYAGLGGNDQTAIIRAAASQELYHAGILMHDDIIDRDLTRWKGLNVSGHYDKLFSLTHPPKQARHLADSYALLAGDCCMDLAYRQLQQSGFSGPRLLRAIDLMHSTFFQMLGGELLDVHVSQQPAVDLKPDMLLDICQYKTASYSFCLPLQIGALLAGTSAETLQQIAELSKYLGLAYQLQDDLLGMFGDPTQTGKSVVSDLREGKRTLLIHYAYQLSDQAGRRTLDSWLGNPAADESGLHAVQTVLKQSGARQKTERLIEIYYHHAQDHLTAIPWYPIYRNLLAQLFQNLLGRSS